MSDQPTPSQKLSNLIQHYNNLSSLSQKFPSYRSIRFLVDYDEYGILKGDVGLKLCGAVSVQTRKNVSTKYYNLYFVNNKIIASRKQAWQRDILLFEEFKS